MTRLFKSDASLDALNDERDHLAIQISLLDDSETPNPARRSALKRQLDVLENRISRYRPTES
jgi:hypothetical protein